MAKEQMQHQEDHEDVEDVEEVKLSFLERGIEWFIREKLFEGYQLLKQKEYRLYSIYLVSILSLVIGGVIFTTEEVGLLSDLWAKKFIMLGITTALAYIVGGLLYKALKGTLQTIITFLLVLTAIGFTFFWEYNYDALIFQWIKLFFLVSWVLISTVSLFSLVLYFFTSLSSKIMLIGKSSNHVFLDWILRLAALGSIGGYVYLFLQETRDAQILAIGGLITALIMLRLLFKSKKRVTAVETNFTQILGFFNLMLIVRLASAFEARGTTVNLLQELAILLVASLFVIQSISGRVHRIEDFQEIQKARMKLQDKAGLFAKIKDFLGERSLILVALGLSLGYPMFVIDNFFDSPIIVLDYFASGDLLVSTIYHRFYLFIGICLFIGSYILFKTSEKFQELVKNKYTFKDALQIFFNMFKRGKEGSPSIIEREIHEGATKVKNYLEDKKNQIFSSFFGKQQKKPPKDRQEKSEQP